MVAGVTIATGVTPAYSLPTNENISAPADTTRVIDIEEVVVIATPKENNRLRQQPLSATSFSQGDMRNNSVTSVKSLSGLFLTFSFLTTVQNLPLPFMSEVSVRESTLLP